MSNIKVVAVHEEVKEDKTEEVIEEQIEDKPEEEEEVVEDKPEEVVEDQTEELHEVKPKVKAKPKGSDRVDCNTCGKNLS